MKVSVLKPLIPSEGALKREQPLASGNDFLKQAEAGLTDIYKNMKPDAAALQLEKANTGIAAAVIMRLGARQSSLILAEMDPEKAAVIANIIASASDPNTSKDPS